MTTKREMLEGMTIDELKAFAADNDVDVSGCQVKDDYVSKLEGATLKSEIEAAAEPDALGDSVQPPAQETVTPDDLPDEGHSPGAPDEDTVSEGVNTARAPDQFPVDPEAKHPTYDSSTGSRRTDQVEGVDALAVDPAEAHDPNEPTPPSA